MFKEYSYNRLHQLKIKISLVLLFILGFIYFAFFPLYAYNIDITKDINHTNSIIQISIKNTEDKIIHILKQDIDPNNNIFSVTFKNKKLPYIGKSIKRKQQSAEYITLLPHMTYVFEVTLSKYYKMNQKGEYLIQYTGNKQRYLKKKLNLIQNRTKNIHVGSFTFSPLFPRESNKIMRKIVNYNQCTQSQIDTIVEAHQKALFLSKNALNNIDSTENFIMSDRYITWFGMTTKVNSLIVKTSFSNITDVLENKNINFDCSCSEPYLAYVFPEEEFKINLCNGFWNATREGLNSQGGIIIQQLSHFVNVASTINYSYGEEDTKRLAELYPHYSIYNADSYEYFAENTPYLTMENIFLNAQPLYIINQLDLQNSLENAYDKDIFKISVSRSGLYRFSSDGFVDTQGTLYSSQHIVLRYNDDSSLTNFNFSLSNYLFKGVVYYLVVNAYADKTGSYVLHVNSINKNLDWLVSMLLDNGLL